MFQLKSAEIVKVRSSKVLVRYLEILSGFHFKKVTLVGLEKNIVYEVS